MNRQEQIEQAWFCKACLSSHCYDEKSFKEAVEWADKTMLIKARKWVKNAFVGPFGEGLADNIADEFVKAMEE